MIKFSDQVPSVYSSASRDFQYLGWLIDIVLNSVKHNIDDIYNLPNTKADPRLTEILAMTLGFRVKRNYDQQQLAALVSIIPSILKCKGTLKAVIMAGEALLTASDSVGMFVYKIENNCLTVVLPKDLIDISLFIDLLPYILPAGMTSRVVRKTQVQHKVPSIEVAYEDVLYAEWHKDLNWNDDAQTSSGLANIFDVDTEDNTPSMSNYKHPITLDEQGMPVLNINAGLLDNTVIPAVDEVLTDYKSNLKEKEG